MITRADAERLEQQFLGGLNDAQDAYEQFVAAEAWTALGHETYVDWWTVKVVPVMRALKMRPTREIVATGIDQVRKEETALPPLQRRTQKELGEMFDVDQKTVSNSERSSRQENSYGRDLGEPAKTKPPAKKRQPITKASKEAALKLRREIEKLERLFADDRLPQNAEQVATLTRSHLTYTMQTCQDLLNQLDKELTSESTTPR